MTLNTLIWQIFNITGSIILVQCYIYGLIPLVMRLPGIRRLRNSRAYKIFLMTMLCVPYWSFRLVNLARKAKLDNAMNVWLCEVMISFTMICVLVCTLPSHNMFYGVGIYGIALLMVIHMPERNDNEGNDDGESDDGPSNPDSPLFKEINAYLKELYLAGQK